MFLKKTNKFIVSKKIYRNKKKQNKLSKYNFTKIWFIKLNNYLLVSTFVFFYFKIKSKKKLSPKKKPFLTKSVSVFWKKKKGDNLKKKNFKKSKKLQF